MTAQALVRFVLTNPLAMAAKAPIKDAIWALRGRSLANPGLPPTVRSILFVCKGNICRSPFAGYRAAQLLAQRGSSIACASAGIQTTQAAASPADACESAKPFGVDLTSHVPVQLDDEMMARYDLIVVMEAAQLELLRQRYPDAAGRVWLLSLVDGYSGYARYHIADPFGQPRAAFDACYRRMDAALSAFLRLIPDPSR